MSGIVNIRQHFCKFVDVIGYFLTRILLVSPKPRFDSNLNFFILSTVSNRQIGRYDAVFKRGLLVLVSNTNFYFFHWAGIISSFRYAWKVLTKRLDSVRDVVHT